jgi:hypothetical protein
MRQPLPLDELRESGCDVSVSEIVLVLAMNSTKHDSTRTLPTRIEPRRDKLMVVPVVRTSSPHSAKSH